MPDKRTGEPGFTLIELIVVLAILAILATLAMTATSGIVDQTRYEKTIQAFDRIVGLGRVGVIHLNDAKKGLGSRVDRHEHIGEGAIGLNAFRFIMNDKRLGAIPKIIETPKKKGRVDYDRVNLERLRSLIT